MKLPTALIAVVIGLCAGPCAVAKVYDKTAEIAGVPVHYKLILPKDYDASKEYPAVLAFPPGSQSMDMVMTTVQRNWAAEAEKRGYIVIVPAAPRGEYFFEGGARVFPQFIEQMLKEYKIKDRKFHIAGMSNGGLSAFYIAASYPQYFWSVTGFPGYLPDPTPARVSALAKMCINMHVGELDTGWLEDMQDQARQFRAKGYTVAFTVEKGQSHVIGTLTGEGAARLFDEIEKAKRGCGK
jgi:poly(3-hydroxybutyrate) depolymerase